MEDDLWWNNNFKNEGNLKNKDDLKNQDDLKIEDDIKKWRHKEHDLNSITWKNLLMTSQLDRHSETDPKPEMLSAV